MTADRSSPATEFSIRGGPVHRLVASRGMSEGRPRFLLALGIMALAGVPLVLLAAAQGVVTPLLRDASVYVRVLIAIPWVILCGTIVNRRLRFAVNQLASGLLVPEPRRAEFDQSLTRLIRARDSWIPDLTLLAVAVLSGWLDVRSGLGQSPSGWLTIGSPAHPSRAGLWFAFVTQPIYHFLLLRWGWRLLLWVLWLWRVSKLDLQVLATHPDRAGGLGFLGGVQSVAFNLLVVPIAVVFSSRAILWLQSGGGSVDQLRFVIGAFALLAILVVHGPLLIFTPLLLAARRRGVFQYGTLAAGYVQAFHGKWIEGRNPSGEPLLGTADIQSLADIGNSLQVVHEMTMIPTRLSNVAGTAAAALVPMLPLLSTVIPIQEILKKVLELATR